jgi:predicted NUDIX family NTP pyrophosphohydrolase
MEWPPKSGKQQEFPEVDRAEWFEVDAARLKILKGQAPFIDQLLRKVQNAESARGSHIASSTGPKNSEQTRQQSLF